MPLSDTRARAAKARERRYRLTDADGLMLEVLPTGRRVWRFRYRLHGRRRDMTLGTYPALKLAAARRARDAARAQVESGSDPIDAARDASRRRDSETFAAVAERWLENGSPVEATRIVRRRALRRLLPQIGQRAVADIDAPMLLCELRGIRERVSVNTALDVLGVARSVMALAVAEGLRSDNPARDLREAIGTRIITNHPALTDPTEFGELLREIDTVPATSTTRNALRLNALVPLRNVEIRFLAWAHVDRADEVLRLPGGHVRKRKGAAFVIPLSRQALAILDNQRTVVSDACPLVFPIQRRPHGFSASGDHWRPIHAATLGEALRRTSFAGRHTPHGFRTSLRTLGDERLGERLDLLERALNHTVGNTVERSYSRGAHTEQLRALFQNWADYVDRLRDGTSAEVLPMRQRA